MGLIPGSGRSPEEGNGYPTPVFLPGELHEQRSLKGYTAWGPKESDTTEQLSMCMRVCACTERERERERERSTVFGKKRGKNEGKLSVVWEIEINYFSKGQSQS